MNKKCSCHGQLNGVVNYYDAQTTQIATTSPAKKLIGYAGIALIAYFLIKGLK